MYLTEDDLINPTRLLVNTALHYIYIYISQFLISLFQDMSNVTIQTAIFKHFIQRHGLTQHIFLSLNN